ncbi:MAG TPA: undecaprenyl-diphosphate phosphatase [Candidatus Obscuribacter sp.]|nr:undecaprenyl-diphosphate phosphatase [Candidatus Obscuribacter sp.]HNG20831.1 undecaprenyl-diphosphate phosphatase [Candidatus Obscuribacter sp.]HNM49668.1 undecaprenyl-diphosphate phosphatase [Candidatus Obscuribacter sp.]
MEEHINAAAAGSISLVEAIVLGIVQGLTEFLPISSTAHLRVVPSLLHWQDPGVAYSAVIQLGSLIAVLAYFYKDIFQIAFGSLKALKEKDFGSRDLRLAGAIIIGTMPVCVVGLLLKHLLEQNDGPFRSLTVIGCAAIFMGLALIAAEKLGKHTRVLDQMGVRDGLLVGLGQAMALIPGCSRSGSTLTVAMLIGLKRADAARFSFLLGVPAIFLSGMLELKSMFETGLSGEGIGSLVAGLLSSTIVSYLAIAWLIRYLQQHSSWIFVIYRLIFGVGVLALSSMQLIK